VVEAQVIVRDGKERSLERRHPWLYAGAIERVIGEPASGATVALIDARGGFLAWAAWSPTSMIRARVWSFNIEDRIDPSWFAARLARAVERRSHLTSRTNAVRLIFGEADGLPGLVVDRYGAQLVIQCLAAGVAAQRDTLVDALLTATGCVDVYERSDAAVRAREGLESITGALRGLTPNAPIEVEEDGIRYGIDIVSGHKTGFYIDQRDNRRAVREEIERLRAQRIGEPVEMLNTFSYTGGFSLAALAGGASTALNVDSSAEALAMAELNAQRNGFGPDQLLVEQSDVFGWLTQAAQAQRRFDLIVLDPPKFAPSAAHVERAARAYKEINRKALGLLRPGGALFTFSCSGAIDVDLFQKIVAGAVIDANIDVSLIRRLGAGDDHPMAMTHPEGEYLKGLLLRRN
jgi:23S rRNA (cytosine1962-C5)-methyltransferase